MTSFVGSFRLVESVRGLWVYRCRICTWRSEEFDPQVDSLPASLETHRHTQTHRHTPRRICAWCGEVLALGVEPVSHGVCQACADEFVNSIADARPCWTCRGRSVVDDPAGPDHGKLDVIDCPTCGGRGFVEERP